MRFVPRIPLALPFGLIVLTVAPFPASLAQRAEEDTGVISFLVASGIRQSADSHTGLTELIDRAAGFKTKPAFIVAVGDVTDSGLASQYTALDSGMKHAKEAGIAVYAVPGSRDVSGNAEGKERFNQTFGKMYESFERNSAHFVLLDSTVPLRGLGHVDKIELDWLERDLKKTKQDEPIFIFLYHSIGQRSPTDRPLDNEFDLLARLKGHNVVAIFSGDSGRDATWAENGITMFASRSSREGSVYLTSLSQLLVSVDRLNINAPTKPMHVANLQTATNTRESQMRVVWDDPDIPFLERRRPAATLSPRVVADNPDTERAVYRIDSGPWKPLIKDRRDIWSDTFPTKGISIGIHSADIQLTTSNDQRDEDESIFEVERDSQEATRKWALDLPASILSSPLLAGQTLYVSCNDGKLYAINVDNGKKRWVFSSKAAFVASPILINGVIYIGSTDKTFYAVEASSGHAKWHTDVQAPILATAACAHGIVCVATAGTVYGLDLVTGEQRWIHLAEGPFESAAATDGDEFYLGGWDNTCFALDAKTGRSRWSVRIGSGASQSPATASPCVLHGNVYFAAGDGMLHCLEVAHGTEIWAKFAPAGGDAISTCSPAACGNSIIVCGDGRLGSVYSFEASNGTLLWHTDIGQTIEASGVRPAPNALSVALMGVRGRAVVLNATKGSSLWGYDLGPGNIFSTPEYDGSRLYTTTMANDVQAINGPGVGK